MTQLDAADVLNWATTGVGATALAQRWNSPLLVNINEHTLTALLDHPDLLDALGKIEDFRNLAQTAAQVVTSSKLLKKAKRENDGQTHQRARRRSSPKLPSVARKSGRSFRSCWRRFRFSCT